MHLQTPIPFQSGGFVFRIVLKNPLLLSVTVRLNFIDAVTRESMVVQSMDTFYNTSLINLVLGTEEVPDFESFSLEVLVFSGELNGPLHRPNTTYSEWFS